MYLERRPLRWKLHRRYRGETQKYTEGARRVFRREERPRTILPQFLAPAHLPGKAPKRRGQLAQREDSGFILGTLAWVCVSRKQPKQQFHSLGKAALEAAIQEASSA